MHLNAGLDVLHQKCAFSVYHNSATSYAPLKGFENWTLVFNHNNKNQINILYLLL